MLSPPRHALLAVFAVALCAPAAFAHDHSLLSHRTSYRHGRHHQQFAALRQRRKPVSYRAAHRRFARLHWRRASDAFAAENFAAPWRAAYAGAAGGGPVASVSNRPARAPAMWRQQQFAGAPAWRGSARPFAYSQWNDDRYAGRNFGEPAQWQDMAEAAASANGVPVSLVDRVIRRESGGNPRAASRGNYGLMQIRLGTARAMGYGGSAAGLLDPATNMTYAVRYLAGAYRAAGGSESRAVALYARGYSAAARVTDASFFGSQPQSATMLRQGVYYGSLRGAYRAYRARPYRRRML